MVKIQVIVGPFPDFELQIRVINDPEELSRFGIKAIEKSEKLLEIITEKLNKKYPDLKLNLEDIIEYHINKEDYEQLGEVVEEFKVDEYL